MNFYSQHGEDRLLWEFFNDKGDGFYIDIGAFDGIHLSNSYIFEKAGWSGICLEAHPFYYEKCKKNRPKSTCIHCACTGDEGNGYITFYSEELGLLSGVEAFDEKKIRKRYAKRGIKFKGFKEVEVPALTLNTILGELEEQPGIDFISIDVEGAELDVLKGLDLETYRPRIFVVEANTDEEELLVDNYLMTGAGFYKARRFHANVFYCSEEKDVDLIRNIAVDKTTLVSKHPLGEAYNSPKAQSFKRRLLLKIKKFFMMKR